MVEFYQFVQNVGFPAAVAIFVLWRLDARLLDIVRELRDLRGLLGERRRGEDHPRRDDYRA